MQIHLNRTVRKINLSKNQKYNIEIYTKSVLFIVRFFQLDENGHCLLLKQNRFLLRKFKLSIRHPTLHSQKVITFVDIIWNLFGKKKKTIKFGQSVNIRICFFYG